MNPTANKRKGSAFEQAVAEYLARHIDPAIERRHLSGAADRGDITGLMIAGHRLVVECKATATPDIAGHLKEAATEAANDHALAGVVAWKRRGVGLDSDAAQGQHVVMLTLASFARLINAANRAAQPSTDSSVLSVEGAALSRLLAQLSAQLRQVAEEGGDGRE